MTFQVTVESYLAAHIIRSSYEFLDFSLNIKENRVIFHNSVKQKLITPILN